ncbi:MAG: hypothetical protein TEF_21580 [Rhizobiales bacterium NRL2]|jgi:hypothetical protein|nr:MAG: hypothetical protein TEF_21580 [Rhizobiales bacterium NRL2]
MDPEMYNDADKLARMVPVLLEALDCMPDGFALYDKDFRPLVVNRESLNRFPIAFDTLSKGGTFLEANRRGIRETRPDIPEEKAERMVRRLTETLEAGETVDLETQNGRIVRTRFREMSEGRRVAISVDITELRAREKELEEARRAAEAANETKSAFLANISHEIRTPLNGILGMSQMLCKANLPPDQKRQAETIAESGQMLMDLLNDVLDLSKIEAGRLDIDPRDGDLGDVMRGLRRLWQPGADEKGLTLSLMLDADLPKRVVFDPVRVRQCANNLISNAIKFTQKGRIQIVVTTETGDDGEPMIQIEVSDSGCGMEEETLARLFHPFTQADSSTSRKHGGTGLGLSITRRLARMMGGDCVAESTPGRGSTFRLSFRADPVIPSRPLQEMGMVDETGQPIDPERCRGLRVLLVDDHLVNRKVASLYLEPYGCAVTEAGNGQEALDRLSAQTFDIVLLDVHMPVMDGPETISRIRQADAPWRKVPVLALTADAMMGDRERYLAMGMDGYVAKPIAERELVGEIVRAARSH